MELVVDLVTHIKRQRAFALKTFGSSDRRERILNHIRKELVEIAQKPRDIFEWIDVIILAIDGATNEGFSAEEVAKALLAKQRVNEQRKWPDISQLDSDAPIEHIKKGVV